MGPLSRLLLDDKQLKCFDAVLDSKRLQQLLYSLLAARSEPV